MTITQLIEHQPRERAVNCCGCLRETWEVSAVCERCREAKETSAS